MSITNKFLKFCELQRNANSIRESKGSNHSMTISAYESANKLKREILTEIEKLESSFDKK